MWKKAVTKNQAKLLIKLADFVAECEQLYDIKIVYGNVVKIKHLKETTQKAVCSQKCWKYHIRAWYRQKKNTITKKY